MKLDVGAGYLPHAPHDPDWVRLDVNPDAPIDVAASALALPFPDRTFWEIHASDVLEHVSYRQTGDVLAEWARVLKQDGRLTVITPDAQTIMRSYVERIDQRERFGSEPRSPADLVGRPLIDTAAWRLLGGHEDNRCAFEGDDWRWNAHYSLFSTDSLAWHLDNVGFDVESMVTNAHPNIVCEARRR